jgi:hypothetical protein
MRAENAHIVDDLIHEFAPLLINLHYLLQLLYLIGSETHITTPALHKLIDEIILFLKTYSPLE